jgi:choline monooxygenase
MPRDTFTFEPDLAVASTLPADWYRDPAMLDRERESVFGRTWQLVGHPEQVPLPGDFFTCTVADEPIVITRGEEGGLHALSNVCRHRAGPVAQGTGHRTTLRCGYHGWTYGLNGELRATPEWEGVRDFDKSRQCLPSFRIETWGPFLFVNLDAAAPPLAEFLGSIPEETRGLRLERMRLFKQLDYEIDCNWKVYVDNYLEGYHIPIVHPGLFRQLDYGAYRVEPAALHSKQHAPLRSAEASCARASRPTGPARRRSTTGSFRT